MPLISNQATPATGEAGLELKPLTGVPIDLRPEAITDATPSPGIRRQLPNVSPASLFSASGVRSGGGPYSGSGITVGMAVGGATVRVNNSSITGNTTGLSLLSGAQILSFGNNRLSGNGSDGAFSNLIPLL